MKNKFKFLATMLIGVLLSVNQAWGAAVTIYSNSGVVGIDETSGINAAGATNDNNGNPAPAWAMTSSSKKTITLTNCDFSTYTNVKFSLEFKSTNSGTTYTKLTVTQYDKNNTQIGSATTINGNATNKANFTKCSDISISTACTKIEIVLTPASTTYNSYVDNILITGEEVAKVAVTWYAAGEEYESSEQIVGSAIIFPENPDPEEFSCSDKVFYGWTTDADYSSETTPPTILTGSDKVLSSGNNYYAVFADVDGEESWTKMGASEISESGIYALIEPGGKAFTGAISSGHGQMTTNAFSFSNGVATSAPTGTMELELIAYEVNDKYLFDIYNADKGYLYATAAEPGKLAWSTTPLTEDDSWRYYNDDSNFEFWHNPEEGYYYASLRAVDGVFKTSTDDSEDGKIIAFAKKSGGYSYSNFTTTCVTCSNEVNVNKGSMTGGDIRISADKVCADDGGGSVTVTPNPDAHYSCTGVTATVGTVTGSGNSYTVSGITAATTISATFVEDAKATVTWSVNGVTKKSSQVYIGETDAAPEVTDADIPTTCANAFVGWSTSTMVGEGHGAPADLFNTTSPEITADRTFNAVFATAVGGGTVTHTMDVPQDVTISGYEERSYTDDKGYTWSGKFSGFDNAGEKFWSLSKNQNNYHISSPTFAGNVSSIKFWVRQTASGTRSIILRSNTSTAQPTESDMGLTADVSQNDEVQEVTITPTTQEFTQFNIYVSDGFGFRKIQVVTGGGVTYSNYVTTCATYTVTWRSNDYEIRVDADKAPGTVLTAPTVSEVRDISAKAACNDHLVGWMPSSSTTNPKYTSPDTAPSDMVGQQVTVTEDVVYHAVYADVVQQ